MQKKASGVAQILRALRNISGRVHSPTQRLQSILLRGRELSAPQEFSTKGLGLDALIKKYSEFAPIRDLVGTDKIIRRVQIPVSLQERARRLQKSIESQIERSGEMYTGPNDELRSAAWENLTGNKFWNTSIPVREYKSNMLGTLIPQGEIGKIPFDSYRAATISPVGRLAQAAVSRQNTAALNAYNSGVGSSSKLTNINDIPWDSKVSGGDTWSEALDYLRSNQANIASEAKFDPRIVDTFGKVRLRPRPTVSVTGYAADKLPEGKHILAPILASREARIGSRLKFNPNLPVRSDSGGRAFDKPQLKDALQEGVQDMLRHEYIGHGSQMALPESAVKMHADQVGRHMTRIAREKGYEFPDLVTDHGRVFRIGNTRGNYLHSEEYLPALYDAQADAYAAAGRDVLATLFRQNQGYLGRYTPLGSPSYARLAEDTMRNQARAGLHQYLMNYSGSLHNPKTGANLFSRPSSTSFGNEPASKPTLNLIEIIKRDKEIQARYPKLKDLLRDTKPKFRSDDTRDYLPLD